MQQLKLTKNLSIISAKNVFKKWHSKFFHLINYQIFQSIMNEDNKFVFKGKILCHKSTTKGLQDITVCMY